MLTIIAYLNDVRVGEAQISRSLDLPFHPKKAMSLFLTILVMIVKMRHSQKLILDPLHAGMPVLSGEKWM